MRYINLYNICTGQQGGSDPKFKSHSESECTAINSFPAGGHIEVQDLIDDIYDLPLSITILIPDMKFTCKGTILQVTVPADYIPKTSNQDIMVQIWRQNSGTVTGGSYSRVGKIALPSMCINNTLMPRMFHDDVYDCVLKETIADSIFVESGDIVGIELPPPLESDVAELKLSVAECVVSSYILDDSLSSTIDLSDDENILRLEYVALPRIRIEVNGTTDIFPGIAIIRINYSFLMNGRPIGD